MKTKMKVKMVLLSPISVVLIGTVLAVSCRASLKATGKNGSPASPGESPGESPDPSQDPAGEFAITGRTPLVVKAGEKVALTGSGFKPDMQLTLAGQALGTTTVADDKSAAWTAPSGIQGGVLALTATQGAAAQKVSVIYQPGDGSIPVITASPDSICSGMQFYDAQGALQIGTKECASGIATQGTWDLRLAFPGSGNYAGISDSPDLSKVLSSVTILGATGTMPDRGAWDAVNSAFPGAGHFTGATLPPVASVCGTGKTGGANGTATCQTGTPSGTDPTAGEILSGKSAWLSSGSVVNGSMASRSGAWSLTSAWPGIGYYDTPPTFPGDKVCNDTNIFGAPGSANCGAYRGNMRSTAHRTVNANQVSLTTETSTGLSGDYRRVPDILLDDDGYDVTSPVVKQIRPSSDCGTSGTIEDRITNCNTIWSGKTNGTSGEGDWKLVTRVTSGTAYEVWRDERTGLIWSDRVGDSTSPIDPDTDDFTANWCQATGNAQAGDPSSYCNNATYQNQTTAESWCGNEATGAVMKGNLGSAQNITWRLPTIYDWNIASANGIRFVLPNMGYGFWSASVVSNDRSSAWRFLGYYGHVVIDYRNFDFAVRCVGAR